MVASAAQFVLLVTGPDGRWRPGIGDPSLMGWLTVVAYFAAAYFALEAARTSRYGERCLARVAPREAANQHQLTKLWILATVVMVALGINKQLDLQTWFTETMRDAARAQGWYEQRRDFQVAFIGAIALAGALGTLTLAYQVRRVVNRVAGAVLGLGVIVSFVVVRAASFHHVDVLLGTGSVRLNWVFELTGIALVGWSARRSVLAARGR